MPSGALANSAQLAVIGIIEAVEEDKQAVGSALASGLTSRGAVRAIARSFMERSAWRKIWVVSTLS